MPSMMDTKIDGEPWPAVGIKKEFAFGGATGPLLRPFALKKCAEVGSREDIFIDIMGSGGIVNADHAISFLRYGAKAL